MKEIVNFSSSVKLQWLGVSTWSLIRYHWSPFLKVRHFEVETNMVGCLSIHSMCYYIKTEAPQLSAKGHQYLCWYLQYLHIKSNLWFAVLKEIQVVCNSKGNRRVNTSSKTYYIPLSSKYNQINSNLLWSIKHAQLAMYINWLEGSLRLKDYNHLGSADV
jgi:hypothetical protein